jgi:hypothetical protein
VCNVATAVIPIGGTEFFGAKCLARGFGWLVKAGKGLRAGKDAKAAAEAYKYATDANKLRHYFQAKHKLGPLVTQFGSREAAVREILNSLKGKTPSSGQFSVTTKVGGQTVKVTGNVDQGVVKMGNAFTP